MRRPYSPFFSLSFIDLPLHLSRGRTLLQRLRLGNALHGAVLIERPDQPLVAMTDVLQRHFERLHPEARARLVHDPPGGTGEFDHVAHAEFVRQDHLAQGNPLRWRAVQFTRAAARRLHDGYRYGAAERAGSHELLLAWVLTVRPPTPIDRHTRSRARVL